MTSSVTLAGIKTALIAGIAALPAMEGVQVSYGFPARTLEREAVYGGASTWTIGQGEGGASSGGTGMGGLGGKWGLVREVTYTVDLHLVVRRPGAEVTETEDRVLQLADAIEAYLASPQRRQDIPGLLHAAVASGETGYSLEDEDTVSTLLLSCRFTAHRT